MLERGSSGLRSPSASNSSLAPLFSFVPTWKTTEKTTPIPKTISDRFCNYTQRGTPHHRCYKQAPAALRSPEDTVGGVIKPWDHILGTKNSDFCPTCQPDSFCCGRRASSPLFKKLSYTVNIIQMQRGRHLYMLSAKVSLMAFMSSPYKYKKEKYTSLLSHCYFLFLCANEGNYVQEGFHL